MAVDELHCSRCDWIASLLSSEKRCGTGVCRLNQRPCIVSEIHGLVQNLGMFVFLYVFVCTIKIWLTVALPDRVRCNDDSLKGTVSIEY